MARQPTVHTLANVSSLLHPFSTYPQAQKFHAVLHKAGLLAGDTHLATTLLSIYSRHLRFSDASLLLQSIPNPDPVSFSTLISAFSKSNHFSDSLLLFHQMLSLNVTPDCYVFPSVLKACAGLSSLCVGQRVHALVLVAGFSEDPFIQSSLVHMYLRGGDMSGARKVFDRMAARSVVSWSAMVAGYARCGCVDEALELFDRMRQSGVEPNSVSWNGLITGFNANGYAMESASVLQKMHLKGFFPDKASFSSALSAFADLEDIVAGMQIHGYAIKCGYESDEALVTALIDMYGKCRRSEEMVQVFGEAGLNVGSCNALIAGLSRNGLVDNALEAFRQFCSEGVELNVISWTSIVACCAQNGKDLEALDHFREMQTVGIRPNSVTIPCLLPACANIAALMEGKSVHCFSLRIGISEDVHVGSASIDMYAKCGRIKDAQTIFDTMPSRNQVSWNAIIGGYAMHGKAKDAMELFSRMQKRGQEPDLVTFTSLLSACSQAGLTEEGLYYFNSMYRDHGIVARPEHYACMVSLLGRAGKLEASYAMIKEMPFEPDACIWGALLSSCRVHGNVNLGEIAAKELFRLEPRNVGNYVLLSNIYATKGMWDGVNRVREKMNNMGLKKNPGCSWIEVKNKVYMLLAGDISDPQMSQIAGYLENLSKEMKKAGYLPSTGFVLQDVEEQDKEQILCGHSEKLAIAFGLLNTSLGTPLRVIKNLRTCGDCHTAIKFISRFEGREIFVRDTNRFHHFKDGECSCGDYW